MKTTAEGRNGKGHDEKKKADYAAPCAAKTLLLLTAGGALLRAKHTAHPRLADAMLAFSVNSTFHYQRYHS